MIELLRQYYLDEKGISGPAFTAAILSLLLAVLLLLRHSAHPVAKGMGTGLIGVGVLLFVIAFTARTFNQRKLDELGSRTSVPELELQQSEVTRMEKVMNVAFRYAFVSFAAIMLAAMVWILLTNSAYWRGIAIAVMILAALATIGDSFNAYRNARYLDAVRAFTPPEP